MIVRYAWIALAAAGAIGLAACETDTTTGGGASTSASTSATTASPNTTGSTTGTPSGSDTNVRGNGSAGSAPAPPAAPTP